MASEPEVERVEFRLVPCWSDVPTTNPLPCPFCGSDDLSIWADVEHRPGGVSNITRASVSCRNCGASGGEEPEGQSFATWNRRAADGSRVEVIAGIPPLPKDRDEDSEPFLPPAYPGVPDP